MANVIRHLVDKLQLMALTFLVIKALLSINFVITVGKVHLVPKVGSHLGRRKYEFCDRILEELLSDH
jgi:hypothetical protein